MVDQLPSTVTVKIDLSREMPPPEGANFFHFTFLRGEVQMLLGYVDLFRIHEMKAPGKTRVIYPEVTHRFSLSALGFAQLKAQVDEIAAKIELMSSSDTPNG
jgi:hypothetical protein